MNCAPTEAVRPSNLVDAVVVLRHSKCVDLPTRNALTLTLAKPRQPVGGEVKNFTNLLFVNVYSA